MGYHTFSIPKKSGGVRVITAPDEALKAINPSPDVRKFAYVKRINLTTKAKARKTLAITKTNTGNSLTRKLRRIL